MRTRSGSFLPRRRPTRGNYIGSKPPRRAPLPSPPVILATLALFFALGGTIVHAHGGDAQAIHACVNNTTGEVTVFADNTGYGNPDSRCQRPTEQHALDWSMTGPAGPAGAKGDPGPAGQTGPQGPPGPQGAGASTLQWYLGKADVKILPGVGNDIILPVLGRRHASVSVPGGNTYFVAATISIASSPELWVHCQLTGTGTSENKKVFGANGHAKAPFSGAKILGSSPDARGKDSAQKAHRQTLALNDVFKLPDRRDGAAKISLGCRSLNSSPGATLGVRYARILEVHLFALRISGGSR